MIRPRADRSRRRTVLALVSVAIVAVVVVVLVVFQPQRLLIDTEVHEALPGLALATSTTAPVIAGAAPGRAEASPSPGGEGAPNAPAASSPTHPIAVARGAFTSVAHPTAGTALLVRLPDGSHLVRLEQLATDNGPDVWVGVSRAAAGSGDYATLRRLEPLKGNIGDQNYVLPPDVEVAALRSVVIWCDRFSVAFGDAPLDGTAAP